MNIKFNEKACRFAVCLITAAAVILGVVFSSQTGAEARLIGKLPSPADAAAVFFEAYRAGDYEKLDKLVYGYSTLGLSDEAESEYGRKMMECLRSELSYELIGDPEINGNRSEVTVKLGYFSVADSAAELKTLFNEQLLVTMKEDSEGVDLNVHDEAYYNGIVLPSLDRAIDDLIGRHGEYMRSRTIKLELVYEKNSWKIVPDDELRSVLLGDLG